VKSKKIQNQQLGQLINQFTQETVMISKKEQN